MNHVKMLMSKKRLNCFHSEVSLRGHLRMLMPVSHEIIFVWEGGQWQLYLVADINIFCCGPTLLIYINCYHYIIFYLRGEVGG